MSFKGYVSLLICCLDDLSIGVNGVLKIPYNVTVGVFNIVPDVFETVLIFSLSSLYSLPWQLFLCFYLRVPLSVLPPQLFYRLLLACFFISAIVLFIFLCLFFSSSSSAAAAKLLQSCPTLCDPMDCSLPGSSANGIFQARILECGAISFSFTSYPFCSW